MGAEVGFVGVRPSPSTIVEEGSGVLSRDASSKSQGGCGELDGGGRI